MSHAHLLWKKKGRWSDNLVHQCSGYRDASKVPYLHTVGQTSRVKKTTKLEVPVTQRSFPLFLSKTKDEGSPHFEVGELVVLENVVANNPCWVKSHLGYALVSTTTCCIYPPFSASDAVNSSGFSVSYKPPALLCSRVSTGNQKKRTKSGMPAATLIPAPVRKAIFLHLPDLM